jgi:hypothetical protein
VTVRSLDNLVDRHASGPRNHNEEGKMDKRERNEQIIRLHERGLTYRKIGERVRLEERQVQRIVKQGEEARKALLRSLGQEVEEPEPEDTSFEQASKLLDSLLSRDLALLRLVRKYDYRLGPSDAMLLLLSERVVTRETAGLRAVLRQLPDAPAPKR